LRRHPTVHLRGYVEDVNREFLSSDVLLVSTPINLGTRTRIIEGFSYGCCVVAHEANGLGIPQIVHGKNALLGKDGSELADAVIRVLTDRSLRERLQSNARRTYEENFSIESAGARLTAELEKIVLNGAAAHRLADGNCHGLL
jgi:polysaccharide biosynthesis protein PslH